MSDLDGSSTKGELPGDVGVPSRVLVRIRDFDTSFSFFLNRFHVASLSENVDILELLSASRIPSVPCEIIPHNEYSRGMMSVGNGPIPQTKMTTISAVQPDIQLLNAGILYLSKSGEMAVFNDIAAELLGRPELSGTISDLDSCCNPESDEYHIFHHVLSTEREYRDVVIKWEAGGTVRHVLLDTFVHQAGTSKVCGMYLVMKDMGNFSVFDQQTQRIEKTATVGQVAAGIAHEIRNPLTTIKGFLQILKCRLECSVMAEEIEYVQMMMSEIERVNTLVSELLLLSRPHDIKRTTFSLYDLFGEISTWIQSNAHNRGLEIMFNVSPGIELTADRTMIRQLLIHLVRNAVDAMDGGGSLSISAKDLKNKIDISVADTGPGIPYYLVDKIFDAFYTTKEHSTGLGLAICQRIVTDHGGQIRVSSKGFGTTLTVSLPVSEQDKSVPEALLPRIYSLFP